MEKLGSWLGKNWDKLVNVLVLVFGAGVFANFWNDFADMFSKHPLQASVLAAIALYAGVKIGRRRRPSDGLDELRASVERDRASFERELACRPRYDQLDDALDEYMAGHAATVEDIDLMDPSFTRTDEEREAKQKIVEQNERIRELEHAKWVSDRMSSGFVPKP